MENEENVVDTTQTEQPEEAQTQQVETPTPNPVGAQPSKNKNIMPIICGVVGVIVIALVLFLLLPKLFMSDKKIVQQEFKTLYKEAIKSVDLMEKNLLDYDLEKDSLGVDGTLTVKSNYKTSEIDLSKLENYSIDYNGVIDKSNNKASGSIKLNDKSKSLIDAKAYIEGKKVYATLGDIYNKTITTEMDKEIKDLEATKSLNPKDLKKIINKAEEVTLGYIKDDDITSEKVEKDINGNKKKYKKVTYKIDENDFEKYFLTEFKNDDEIMEIIANLSNVKTSEIKENIDDELESLKDKDKSELLISIYLDGSKVKEIELKENTDNDSDEYIFTITIDNDIYNYKFTGDDKTLFSGEYNTKDRTFTFDMDDDSTKVALDIDVEKDNQIKGNLKVDSDYYKVTAKFDYSAVVKKSSEKTDLKLDVSYKAGDENITATVTNKSEVTKKAKVEELSKSNTVDIDSITDSDMSTISSNFIEKLTPVMKDVMPNGMY